MQPGGPLKGKHIEIVEFQCHPVECGLGRKIDNPFYGTLKRELGR
jgi:hypothetical protein